MKDYDLVYFDPDDVTASTERAIEAQAMRLFADLPVKVDLTNQARVHLWYGEHFGQNITPYRSTEHAISTWPTTATSIGIRYENGTLVACAPFGLTDLFGLVVRPNKTLIDRTVYEAKVQRWTAIWPNLSIIPW